MLCQFFISANKNVLVNNIQHVEKKFLVPIFLSHIINVLTAGFEQVGELKLLKDKRYYFNGSREDSIIDLAVSLGKLSFSMIINKN